ncbi:MAG TPA: anthranilate phosphoribosyltransferase [Bryobacteraceae bacterium]|nr:anthranilate phosphoribosyltransferase [Bryobacteraceae bacterium]
MSFVSYLHKAVNRENLSSAEAQFVMELILAGSATTPQIAAFLVALRMKGETPDELVGFARAMRAKSIKVKTGISGEHVVDTCGTGGDGSCTFNISTVCAFVVAGAGVKVAKHGNRSLSSQCGSADILEALGVNLTLSPTQIARSIREVGIGFMLAPAMHPAMKHAQPARLDLKMRTAFNLLGPLVNPANPTAQVVGAPSLRSAELIAESLASLGLQRGFVVHGLDGLDEVTTTDETRVLEIRGGAIAEHTLRPEDFGVPTADPGDLKGADKVTNADIAMSILKGSAGPKRDIVLVNSSVALVAAGKAADFMEGVRLAAESVDSGCALGKLRQMSAFSQAAMSA